MFLSKANHELTCVLRVHFTAANQAKAHDLKQIIDAPLTAPNPRKDLLRASITGRLQSAQLTDFQGELMLAPEPLPPHYAFADLTGVPSN
jgi:hypothetical protein